MAKKRILVEPKVRPSKSEKEAALAVLKKHNWKEGSSTRGMSVSARAEVKAALKKLMNCEVVLQSPKRKEPKQVKAPRVGPSAKKSE